MGADADLGRRPAGWRDIGFVLAVSLAVAVLGSDWSQRVETSYLDLFQAQRAGKPARRLLLVDSAALPDEAGGARALARLIDALASNGATQIVSLVPPEALWSTPDSRAPADDSATTGEAPGVELTRLREQLAGMSALVVATARAKNVFYALPAGRPGERISTACLEHGLPLAAAAGSPALAALPGAQLGSIPDPLCRAAAGVGHVQYLADADGVRRRTALLLRTRDALVPALAAHVAAATLGQAGSEPQIDAAGTLLIGSRQFAENTGYATFDRALDPADIPQISPAALLAGEVDAAAIRNRIVLIGPSPQTAARPTADGRLALVADGGRLTTSLASLLSGSHVVRPAWTGLLEWGLLACCALLPLMLTWLRQPILRGTLAVAFALGLIAGQGYLIIDAGIWLQTLTPAMVLLLGAGGLELLRSFAPPAARVTHGASSASSIVVEHQHDTLDMEFAILRSQPNNATTKRSLYELAVRYSRGRQLAEAERVLRHLAMLDPTYRRVREKLARLSGLDETRAAEATRALETDSDLQMVPSEMPWGDRRQGARRAGGNGPGQGRRTSDQLVESEQPKVARLGRYNLLRELGSGAMAHVYLAEDPMMRRQVAIKTLALAEEFADADLQSAREQFVREAQAAGRLNHPNIVAIYDFGEENGLSYIVMEYFAGRPITAYTVAERLLPPQWALELVAQAADALHYAHARDVIHRDIKPGNLMYDPGADILKVADFGIARMTDTKRTRTGIIMGTPSYMAPEQFRGDGVDGRADIYSLGVTLYQLLTGNVPFRALSIPRLLEQIVYQEHEPATAVRPGLPPAVDEVLARSLAKDPERRFADGHAMSMALRECRRAMAA